MPARVPNCQRCLLRRVYSGFRIAECRVQAEGAERTQSLWRSAAGGTNERAARTEWQLRIQNGEVRIYANKRNGLDEEKSRLALM